MGGVWSYEDAGGLIKGMNNTGLHTILRQSSYSARTLHGLIRLSELGLDVPLSSVMTDGRRLLSSNFPAARAPG